MCSPSINWYSPIIFLTTDTLYYDRNFYHVGKILYSSISSMCFTLAIGNLGVRILFLHGVHPQQTDTNIQQLLPCAPENVLMHNHHQTFDDRLSSCNVATMNLQFSYKINKLSFHNVRTIILHFLKHSENYKTTCTKGGFENLSLQQRSGTPILHNADQLNMPDAFSSSQKLSHQCFSW